MGDMRRHVLDELRESIGSGEFELPTLFDGPIHLGSDMRGNVENQRQRIDCFFDTVISMARSALTSNDTRLNAMLFSQPVAGMDLEYHRNLPDCCWSKPVFYRTDQSVEGKIYEIQSPGSGWGDIPLYATCLRKLGYDLANVASDFSRDYAQSIMSLTNARQPKVYHMLDASSAPAGMRYLFAQTRPMLRYWGLDADVSMRDVDYVTAHSAAALVASNFSGSYLSGAASGKTIFGIPPNLIFDQKAIYLLPFHRHTANAFSDEIRALFPFTTLVEDGGFFNSDGEFETIAHFLAKPPRQRRYFLKYGGPDLDRNWGSHSVCRLSGSDCARLLCQADELSRRGEIWLIQEDVSRKGSKDIPDDVRIMIGDKYHVKLSVFSGPDRTLGMKVMARKHFKVHGQRDAYVGLGVLCDKPTT